jgi:hypothetical protein
MFRERVTMKYVIFAAVTAALSATSAFAAGPGWVVDAKVSKIVVTVDGGINVRLTPDLSGCTSQSGYGALYASVYPSHPGINRIHSTLLTAYASDKLVAIYLMDSTCKVGEIELGSR